MTFAYFGAKHGLARYYPEPKHSTIIEPFSGSGAYSIFWAKPYHRIVLNDLNEEVIDTLRKVKRDGIGYIRKLDDEMRSQEYVTTPALRFMQGASGITSQRTKNNDFMKRNWKTYRKKMFQAAKVLQSDRVEISSVDYRELSNDRATWFIDPPYKPYDTIAGDGYKGGVDSIDYAELAVWCRERNGQVIVCEQYPADWLPFRPFRKQAAMTTNYKQTSQQKPGRLEVVYTQG